MHPHPPLTSRELTAQSAAREPTERQGPSRLLIAEDDPSFRTMLASSFRADGYEVVEVSNGSDLVDALGRSMLPATNIEPFDLVVSDVRMPGWSGLEALASMGTGPPAPPVVLITAFGDEDLHARGHLAGAVAVIDKPLDIDDLRALVCRVLSERAS